MKMKATRLGKNTNLLTYGIVIAAYLVMQLLSSGGMLTRSVSGYLIPICVYIVLAVSLNLVVGISGELSLGHAGFMGVGAFSGIVAAACLQGLVPNDFLRLILAMLAGGVMAGIMGNIAAGYNVLQYGPYDNYRKNQDTALWIKLLSAGCKGANCPEPLFLFRFDDKTYQRRKSWVNTKLLLQIRWDGYRRGFNSLWDFLVVAVGQLGIFLMPVGLQQKVYQVFLRK